MDMYRILENFDAVNGKKTLTESARVNEELDEERRSPEEFDDDAMAKQRARLAREKQKIMMQRKISGQDSGKPPVVKDKDIAESDMDESALQAYLGKKKYGSEGMKALQQAGREGASREKMAKIRASHDKMDEGDMEEGNKFAHNVLKAKAAGMKKADLDGDGDMETVREVFPGTSEYELRFGKDDASSAFDKKKISTGTVYSRKHFDEPDTDDDAPRAAGRPKGTGRKLGAKGPSVASKLLKGKGGLKEYEMEHDHMNGLDRDEYDQEGQMARQDLHTMVDAARELHAILGSDENLPEWVQSKITKALDYIDTARDYMQSVDAERGDQPVAEIAPVIGAMAGRALAGAAGAGSVGQALGGLAGRAVAGAMNSGNDDVAEASPPGGFKAGDKVTVDGQKGPTGSTTGVFVQQLPTRNDQQPAYAFRFDDKKYPGNTYDTVAGNQIFPAGVSEATGDAGFDSMMGTMQVNVELSKNVMEEFLTIYYGALDGEDMTDNISDELGDHFSQVRRSKDPVLKKCYKAVRELADDEIDAQLKGTLRAIRMMLGDPAYTPPPKPPMSASDQVWVDRLVNAMTAALASHGIKAHPNWLNKEPGNNKEPGVSEAGYSAKAGRAGKDLGKPGKNFGKIAAGAAERYGSKAAGERVAGAVLNKLRAKEGIDEQGTDEGYFSDLDVQRKDKQLKGTQAYHAKKKSEKEQRSADSKQSFNNMLGGSAAELTKKLKIRDVEEYDTSNRNTKTKKEPTLNLPTMAKQVDTKSHSREDDRPMSSAASITRKRSYMEEPTDKKDVPFDGPYRTKDDDKDQYGNKIKHAARHAARQGLADMTTAELKAELKRRSQVEEESTDTEDQHAEKAGKKVAKDIEHDEGHKGKDDAKAEKAGKKVAKDIEYDDKEKAKGKKEVEETTVSGSVAPAAGSGAPKSKNGMQFGKGVYEGQVAESFELKLDNILNEGMSVNVSTDDTGKKSISVNATDADAEALGDLLKMAGLFASEGSGNTCPNCNGMHHADVCPGHAMEEDLSNSPDPVYTDTDYMTQTLSGGLNGPKTTGQTTGAVVNRQDSRQGVMAEAGKVTEQAESRLWNLYKQYEKK